MSLRDANPQAKRADTSPHEAAIILAAKRFAQLDDEVMTYIGPRSGPTYEALLAKWREARTKLVSVTLGSDAA